MNSSIGGNWLVICSNYFRDPFFIDISEATKGFPVYYDKHATGTWMAIKVSGRLKNFSNQLKELKDLEENKDNILQKLENEFDLQNALWQEVYENIREEETE